MESKLKIPLSELDFHFSRSSGAGGQNVNKVNSKVTLYWRFKTSKIFYREDVLERFFLKYSHHILEDGSIMITSQRFRSQARNIADCVEKLQSMVESVWQTPRVRKATQPTKTSVEKRLRNKDRHSQLKEARRKIYE